MVEESSWYLSSHYLVMVVIVVIFMSSISGLLLHFRIYINFGSLFEWESLSQQDLIKMKVHEDAIDVK